VPAAAGRPRPGLRASSCSSELPGRAEDNQLNADRRVTGIPLRSYRTSGPVVRTRANRPSRSDRPGAAAGVRARPRPAGCQAGGGSRRAPPGRYPTRPGSHPRPGSVRAAWAKEAPERGWRGEQGAADVEDPGTQRARSRVLDRCPEGGTRILAAFPRAQCFFLRRRGGAAARRPERSGRPRSRTGPRIRSTGSAHVRRPAGCPTRPRRRWTAGRTRTP